MGNLRSVQKALERVGSEGFITGDPEAAGEAAGMILPGVGAFPRAMRSVREAGLDALVADRIEAGVPVLGICLGLQLLFESSTERGGAAGIGVLPGAVTGLEAPGLKVPHMGWEPVRWEGESELVTGLETGTPFYFVHSFAPIPTQSDLLGSAVYGARFACAAEYDNIFGVQFHPEKSSAAGLRLLSNFAGICVRAPTPA